MPEPIELRFVTAVAAPPDVVWERAGSVDGINAELWPFATMTFPVHLDRRTPPEQVVGHDFRSWTLALGLVPIDRRTVRSLSCPSPGVLKGIGAVSLAFNKLTAFPDLGRPPMSQLPHVVAHYQDAHDRRDVEAALATFAPDATVMDDGHQYRGLDEVRHWLARASTEFTYTRTLLGADAIDANTWLVTNHLEGNFPGGVVDLRYRFVLADDLIAELEIAP